MNETIYFDATELLGYLLKYQRVLGCFQVNHFVSSVDLL